MKKRFFSLICMAFIASLVFLQASPAAFAEEPAESEIDLGIIQIPFNHYVKTAFLGKPDPGILRSTLIYLFPEEALKVNRLIIDNYASDPDMTYQHFLPYQEQALYWYYGRYFIKPQMVSDVLLYGEMLLRHPIYYALGYRNALMDEVGAYREMYSFVDDTLNLFEQF